MSAPRYRADQLIETRGLARIRRGWDLQTNEPIEIHSVPAPEGEQQRVALSERLGRVRAAASGPFLLGIRDLLIENDGGYALITERFDGTDLGVFETRGQLTHVFGAVSLAAQVGLGVQALHRTSIVAGSLAPQCIRLNFAQTVSKIVDFEHATPLTMTAQTAGSIDGYPLIAPPERWAGAALSPAQDVYQLGNLLLGLLTGQPAVSQQLPARLRPPSDPIFVEKPKLRDRIAGAVICACARHTEPQDAWAAQRKREMSTPGFIASRLAPLLAECLNPVPERRPGIDSVVDALLVLCAAQNGQLMRPGGQPLEAALFPVAKS